MRKLLLLAGIFTVLAYNAQARYYEEDGYYYEEQPRYEQRRVRYRDEPQYERPVRYREEPRFTRQSPQYRQISREEEREYNERKYVANNSNTVRPYIGLDVATTKIEFEDNEYDDYEDFLSDSHNAFSLNAGLKFNQNFGVEAFIQQSSEETKSDYWDYKTKTQFNAIGLDVIGYLPISQEFELLASLGMAQYNFHVKEEYDMGEYIAWEKDSLNTIGYRVGLGAQYNINEHFALRAMARYIKFCDDDIIKNMTEFSLGLRYMF